MYRSPNSRHFLGILFDFPRARHNAEQSRSPINGKDSTILGKIGLVRNGTEYRFGDRILKIIDNAVNAIAIINAIILMRSLFFNFMSVTTRTIFTC
jgi:hypothetical protein